MIDTLTLTPIAVPRTSDGPDARDFVAAAEVLNRSVAFDIGSDHLRRDAAETLPGWQDQTDTLHGGLVARRDEVVVGALIYEGPQAAAATELEFELGVAPESRGTGIETALLAALEEAARLLGRTTLQTYATHATDTGLPMLPSPTGFGGVPLDGCAGARRGSPPRGCSCRWRRSSTSRPAPSSPTTSWRSAATARGRPTSGARSSSASTGRRLGTIVTCANILHWRETVPTSPFISTFNAEENRPMLDVNEALGFTPIAIGGAWQRTLD